jgi:hypothetical protein
MQKIVIVLASFVILIAILLFSIFFSEQDKGPFIDVIFKEEYHGATGRHITFTPVLRADESKVIGEAVSADYGVLRYRDCDGDGVNEAIVESDEFIESGEYKASVRYVYKFVLKENNEPRVELISTEYMPEKDPKWIGKEVKEKNPSRFCDEG